MLSFFESSCQNSNNFHTFVKNNNIQTMRFFILFCFIPFVNICNAQQIISIPLQTSIDTTTIGNVIQILQDVDTVSSPKDTIIIPLNTANAATDLSPLQDTIFGATDSLNQANDSLKQSLVIETNINPENITISKIITGEYWISNTKHTDIMIDSSIITKLVIENIECAYLSINGVMVSQMIIKNSIITDFEIDDSSIGELRIENGKIIEFSAEQSTIQKQIIVSKPIRQHKQEVIPTIESDDDDDE